MPPHANCFFEAFPGGKRCLFSQAGDPCNNVVKEDSTAEDKHSQQPAHFGPPPSDLPFYARAPDSSLETEKTSLRSPISFSQGQGRLRRPQHHRDLRRAANLRTTNPTTNPTTVFSRSLPTASSTSSIAPSKKGRRPEIKRLTNTDDYLPDLDFVAMENPDPDGTFHSQIRDLY